MSILVKKSGILTTFQDSGRIGFRRFGINPNGATDKTAARLTNILLGNKEAETVLEIHFPAPIFEFERQAIFAVGGADFSACLNKKPIENFRPIFAEKGDVLEFPERTFGARIYLAVKGGFRCESWLNSASANLKIGFGKNLLKDERIFLKQEITNPQSGNFKISNSLLPRYSDFPTVRVMPGAEFNNLTALSAEIFRKKSFSVTPNSDRMGFRLDGEPIYLIESTELISSSVNFGTIQLLPDGQLIILMSDHQTTGGYPRIAQIAEIDLPLVAQLNPKDKIYFKIISNAEAEDLFFEREKDFARLKIGLKMQEKFNTNAL